MQVFKSQSGTTFVELIITIVVISIGLSTILTVMNQNLSTSSDPLIRHQAIAIAEAYLEEIVEKPFADPGGPAEMGRGDFDDISDYTVIVNQAPQDQNGNPIIGLENYRVTVTVVNEAVGPAMIQAPAGDTFRITVAVTAPIPPDVQLSAYRTNYF